jgi:hypothetical protein
MRESSGMQLFQSFQEGVSIAELARAADQPAECIEGRLRAAARAMVRRKALHCRVGRQWPCVFGDAD